MARWPHQPVAELERRGPLHPTSGLPGYPAHDWFAPAGSNVTSPATGTVVKTSGHDPRLGPPDGPHGPFGWSVYIRRGRKTYYLTHLGTRAVRVGQELHRGQVIGTVGAYSNWGGVDHIHMGVHTAP